MESAAEGDGGGECAEEEEEGDDDDDDDDDDDGGDENEGEDPLSQPFVFSSLRIRERMVASGTSEPDCMIFSTSSPAGLLVSLLVRSDMLRRRGGGRLF